MLKVNMCIKPIEIDDDYRAVLKEVEALMMANAGTSRGERLDILVASIEDYERKYFSVDLPELLKPIDNNNR